MSQLIECVPNFSEGQSASVVEAIRKTIEDCSGIELWDHSSDREHNRSVFTLAGDAAAMEECVVRFVGTAAELIDMETHRGLHPCIGAADVIPFIPLRDCSMEDCIALSRRTAARLAETYQMPVYLYAQSAVNPAHRRLADIRRGGYAALKAEISENESRKPDFGPCALPRFGGASVGARDFLIAFNIYLKTDDAAIAKQIAKQIRESSGGLKGVQAIGLPVNGQAQVSMNLLDYRATPLRTLFAAVEEATHELGTAPDWSELIGLLPEAALDGTSAEALLIRDFSPERIIESHLR